MRLPASSLVWILSAPLPAAPAEPVCVGPRGGGGGAPTLKIKVASVLDQASDREVERMPVDILNKLRARFRAVDGGASRDRAIRRFRGVAPIRATCGQKHEVKKFLDPTHCLRGRRAGVSSALRPSCAISLRSVGRYAAAFRTRVERFQDSWPLCALADARCRSEHWEAEHRRQSLFHDSSPELSAYVHDIFIQNTFIQF